MLGFRKIAAAIVGKLEEKVPGVEIQTQDISEGFKRPSFFVELDNIKISDFMTKIQERDITVRIIYFPSKPNKNQVELLDKMDLLTSGFIEDNRIKLDEGFFTEVEKADMTIVDRVLHFDFKIYLSEEYVRELNAQMMEELQIKGLEEVQDVNK